MTASAVAGSSALAASQSQSHAKAPSSSKTTNAATASAFQQSLHQYLQNTRSGAGGATGANPTQTLSSSLMSSLLHMQG